MDTILDGDESTDTISLGFGLIENNLVFKRKQNNLDLTFSTGEVITVKNMFNGISGELNTYFAIENIQFSNGDLIDTAQIILKTLIGTDVGDTIYGFASDDVIAGGKNNDNLHGGNGNDVYKFSLGDGIDTIFELSGSDALELGVGIAPNNIIIRNTGSTLEVNISADNKIIIADMFSNTTGALQSENAIENIKFLDGTIWELDAIKQKVIESTNSRDVIYAFDTEDILSGGDGSDTLFGNAGNDVLIGGKDADALDGGLGDDSYQYSLGDGDDVISDYSGSNQIIFGQGVNEQDISVQSDGSNRLIVDIYSGGSITVDDVSALKFIRFANGHIWNASDITSIAKMSDQTVNTRTGDSGNNILPGGVNSDVFNGGLGADSLYGAGGNDTLLGGDGNDVLVAGTGDDSLSGGNNDDILYGGTGYDTLNGDSGNDILYTGFSSSLYGGSGNDIYRIGDVSNTWISDTGGVDEIQFGASISSDTFIVRRSGIDLVLNSDAQKIILANTLSSDASFNLSTVIEKYTFANGDQWDLNAVRLQALKGTDESEEIQGFSTDDIINGGLGNDTLIGESGSDIYKYLLGDGSDVIIDRSGNDKIIFGAGIDASQLTFERNSDFMTVIVHEKDSNSIVGVISITSSQGAQRIESITFSDGTTFDLISIYQSLGYDVIAPDIPIANFDTSGKIIAGSSEAGSIIEVTNSINSTVLGSTTVDSSGNYSVTLAKALINSELVNVTAKDDAGNVSIVTAIKAPDKTAPILTSAAFDTTYGFVKGNAEAGSTIIVKKGTLELARAIVDNTGAYNVTLPTVLINKETIAVTATDLANNTSQPKTLTAPDKTAPTIPTAVIDTAGKIVSGNAEAGSTVTVKNAAGTTLVTATASATGKYSATLTTALLNFEVLKITATDVAKNVSLVKTINAPDKTAPGLPSATIDATGKIVTGTTEAGAVVSVKNAANTVLKTVTADATGKYTATLATALLNFEVLNITSKDAAGNVSLVKTINAPDKTAPGKPSAAFDATGKLISGNAEAGSTVIVKNAAAAQIGTATASATGAYTVTLPTALKNKEVVSVTAKDAAGNISAVTSATAPLIATAIAAPKVVSKTSSSSLAQVDAMIQAMASFAPPAASESKVLVGVYHDSHPLLASQS